MIVRTLIGSILLLAMAGAQAAMYKWKDEHGNTQFGQFPPAGIQAEQMKPPRAPSSSPVKSGPSLQERVKALEKKQGRDREKALMEKEDRERAAQLKQNCENARETARLLQRGGNRMYQMPDGTYKRFNAEESQQRIKASEQYIKENCS